MINQSNEIEQWQILAAGAHTRLFLEGDGNTANN
jgi:hypothetical protein